MYATCLFCNAALGANESIEHFPVGRRLAYDAATGRLWVVCHSCARWNLSPLETRWEAIEEAERLFRATRLRASSDNIGLARLKDGTELVRIGKPLKTEFAAWRYGDQFGKRRRQMWRTAGTTVALSAGSLALLSPQLFGVNPFVFGTSAFGLGLAVNFAGSAKTGVDAWKKLRKIATTVRDENGALLRLTEANAREVTLISTGHDLEWKLKVPRNRVKAAGTMTRLLGQKEAVSWADDRTYLSNDVALRALTTILPHINAAGASKRGINDALAVIDGEPSLQHLLHKASTSPPKYQKEHYMESGGSPLGHLPASLQLALEISLHSDDERRVMEGELQELEQRWKDADEIAKISDNLLLRDSVDSELEKLHTRREQP